MCFLISLPSMATVRSAEVSGSCRGQQLPLDGFLSSSVPRSGRYSDVHVA